MIKIDPKRHVNVRDLFLFLSVHFNLISLDLKLGNFNWTSESSILSSCEEQK